MFPLIHGLHQTRDKIVSAFVYNGSSRLLNAGATTTTTCLFWSPDGKNLFISNPDAHNEVLWFELSVPYDAVDIEIGDASGSFNFGLGTTGSGSQEGMYWDSPRDYFISRQDGAIARYATTADWDISTSSIVGSEISVSPRTEDIWFSADLNEMISLDDSTGILTEWSLTSGDISTLTQTGVTFDLGASEHTGFACSSDRNQLIAINNTDKVADRFLFGSKFDLTTLVFDKQVVDLEGVVIGNIAMEGYGRKVSTLTGFDGVYPTPADVNSVVKSYIDSDQDISITDERFAYSASSLSHTIDTSTTEPFQKRFLVIWRSASAVVSPPANATLVSSVTDAAVSIAGDVYEVDADSVTLNLSSASLMHTQFFAVDAAGVISVSLENTEAPPQLTGQYVFQPQRFTAGGSGLCIQVCIDGYTFTSSNTEFYCNWPQMTPEVMDNSLGTYRNELNVSYRYIKSGGSVGGQFWKNHGNHSVAFMHILLSTG